jgi:putative redox protein
MKEQPPAPLHVELRWDDRERFHVKSPSGASAILDGEKEVGLSPMEALLAALCGCMAGDVAGILRKMRLEFSALSVSASGHQNPTIPKYFKRISIQFTVKGRVPPDRLERAVQLTRKGYCSVIQTLRPDLEITHSVSVEES